MPHTIRPKRYLVELEATADSPTPTRTYECRVIAADILKAEEAAPTYGIKPDRSPIALTVMWVWAASRREGHTSLGWPDFRAALIDWMDLSKATTPEEAVDPTRPAGHTPSPSSSPSASEDSTSTAGNTPSPTIPL